MITKKSSFSMRLTGTHGLKLLSVKNGVSFLRLALPAYRLDVSIYNGLKECLQSYFWDNMIHKHSLSYTDPSSAAGKSSM